jgi:putative DNA primase/helicase
MSAFDPVKNILSRLPNPEPTGDGQWTARCPCHDDDKSSLCIGRGDDGRALVKCQAGCETKAVVEAAGLKMADLFPRTNGHSGNGKANGKHKPRGKIAAVYHYTDEAGKTLFDAVRFDPKDFRQGRPKPDGKGWVWDIGDVRRVLYRLPQLTRAALSKPVLIVEGEKDVASLERFGGFLATTNPMGALKWSPEYNETLRGRKVLILPDNDETGRKHAQQVASNLFGIAEMIRVVELPGLPPKGDVSDWIAAGGTLDKLKELVRATPDWQPSLDATPDVATESEDPNPKHRRAQEHEDDPHRLAKLFYGMHACLSGLHHYRGNFYIWEKGQAAYRKLESDEIEGKLVAFIKDEFEEIAEKEAVFAKEGAVIHVRKVARGLVGDVLMALRSICQLPDHADAPFWVSREDDRWVEGSGAFPPRECLSMPNGILHLPSFVRGDNCISEPTPRLFTTNGLTFLYDPNATCPHWLKFINEDIFQLDGQQQDTLAELAWYLLTPRTEQQKLFMFIGPKRSGKGTIGRVLRMLIGDQNVATPTLGSLANPFGLEPLLGKTVAVIGDCRLSGRVDTAFIVERVLSITGEDPQDIDRKYRSTISATRLPVRFLLLSNEVPSLGDASATLPSRAILFRLTESFYGREDPKLIDRLRAELPGILNWALAAGKRFEERGRFLQPLSGQELVETAEELSSPVNAFVDDYLIRDVGEQISITRLRELWKEWTAEHGIKARPIHFVSRDLQALIPTLRIERPRDKESGEQIRQYVGVGENLNRTFERNKSRETPAESAAETARESAVSDDETSFESPESSDF